MKLQEDAGLHNATKIRRQHLDYAKEKMKVKLAVETLSNSVADAIEYCDKKFNISQFSQSEGT